MTQEALRIALDALETELSIDWTNNDEFNASAEKMYKAIDAIKKALAQPKQEPVAWRTFDGEGGYDYRSYEDNESYADDWDKRNPNHKDWVDKLYTHSQRTEQETVADAYALADKVREAFDRKACPDAFMRIAYESIIKNYTTPPQRTEQETVAWRFTGIAGLKRYMTQKQYDAQTPETKKWYEPFRCANCITPPQSTEICCQQYDTCLKPCTPRGEHLAQRTWVGLTDVEIDYLLGSTAGENEETHISFARAIESKLKELNT